MYINTIKIRNAKSISEAYICFDKGKEAGWHVVVGCSGKTTLLQSIAQCVVGEVYKNPNFLPWIKRGQVNAFVEVDNNSMEIEKDIVPIGNSYSTDDKIFKTKRIENRFFAGYKNIQSQGFSNMYPDYDTFGYTAHVHTLLQVDYNVDLRHVMPWLVDVALADYDKDRKVLDGINRSIKTLLHGFSEWNDLDISHMMLHSDSRDEFLTWLDNIGDRTRSIILLVLDLIRCAYEVDLNSITESDFASDGIITLAGTVLIDDIDKITTTEMQGKIGQRLTAVFPNVQFIVTTSSPFVCGSGNGILIGLVNEHDGVVVSEMKTKTQLLSDF